MKYNSYIAKLEKRITVTPADYQHSVFHSRRYTALLLLVFFTLLLLVLVGLLVISFFPEIYTTIDDMPHLANGIPIKIAGINLGLVLQIHLLLALIVLCWYWVVKINRAKNSRILIKNGIVSCQGKDKTWWSVSMLDIENFWGDRGIWYYRGSHSSPNLYIADKYNRHFTISYNQYVNLNKFCAILAQSETFCKKNNITLSNDYIPVDNTQGFRQYNCEKTRALFTRVGSCFFPRSKVITIGKVPGGTPDNTTVRTRIGGIVTVGLYLLVCLALLLVSADNWRQTLHLPPSEEQLQALAQIPDSKTVKYAYFGDDVDSIAAMQALEIHRRHGIVYLNEYYHGPIRVSTPEDIDLFIRTHKAIITQFVDQWQSAYSPYLYYKKVLIVYELNNGEIITKVFNKKFRKADRLPLLKSASNRSYLMGLFDLFVKQISDNVTRVFLSYRNPDETADKYYAYNDFIKVTDMEAFTAALKADIFHPLRRTFLYRVGTVKFLDQKQREVSFDFGKNFEPYIKQILAEQQLQSDH